MITVKFTDWIHDISYEGQRKAYEVSVYENEQVLAIFKVTTNPKCGWKSLLGAAARQLAKTKEGVSGAMKEKPESRQLGLFDKLAPKTVNDNDYIVKTN